MAYTTDDFILAVKRDSFLPAVQSQWSDSRILAVADKCVSRRIIPIFIGVGDGFYREPVDTTLVAEQAGYDVPKYAAMNKIHLARLVQSDGKTQGKLLSLTPSDRDYFNATTSGVPRRMEFNADQMTLVPAPSASVLTTWPTLRTWIYRRPGRMVTVASAAVVQSVDTATGIVTYTASKPATFTASSVHDVYRASSPNRRAVSAMTATASPGGTTQTFSLANAALLQAGDYVCVQDETVFPPCSIEIQPFLVELTILSISITQGDKTAIENSMKQLTDDMTLLVAAAANRADAMPNVATLLRSPFIRSLGRRGQRSTLT